MPFKSKEQEHYLRMNEPKIYREWMDKYGPYKEAETFHADEEESTPDTGMEHFLMDYFDMNDKMYSEHEGRMWGWTDAKGTFLCTRFWKWLKENGTFYARDVETTNRLVGDVYHKPRIKECYYTSLMLLSDNLPSDLKYCEGYMISSSIPIPIEHAWNILDGKVLDFTATLWERDDEERLYFGVEMPKDWVIPHMLDAEITGPYIFDYAYEQLKGMS